MRTVILWLVLLAVPFQGFASAAVLGCITGHGGQMPPAPATSMPAHAQHDIHAMHDMHGGEHHAMPALDAGDDHHAMQHHGNAKCGACSACSLGASMAPAAIPALPVHAPPRVAALFAAGALPSVDLDLPERPPRFVLA